MMHVMRIGYKMSTSNLGCEMLLTWMSKYYSGSSTIGLHLVSFARHSDAKGQSDTA